MPLFDGKVAIVTGGSSGTGRAACHLYARQRAKGIGAALFGEQYEVAADAGGW